MKQYLGHEKYRRRDGDASSQKAHAQRENVLFNDAPDAGAIPAVSTRYPSKLGASEYVLRMAGIEQNKTSPRRVPGATPHHLVGAYLSYAPARMRNTSSAL